MQKIDDLNTQLDEAKYQLGMANSLHTQVQNLVDDGYVKQTDQGDLEPVENIQER